MPERDIEDKIRAIESAEDFRSLKDFGVLKVNPYSEARWASRRFAGRELRASDSALPEFLNGQGSLARLIERVGQERFEECFLQENKSILSTFRANSQPPRLRLRRRRRFTVASPE